MNANFKYKRSSGYWALEYSYSQESFHIRALEDSILTNLQMFFEGQACDYAIITIATSHKEASDICNMLDIRKDRSKPFTKEQIRDIMADLINQGVLQPRSTGRAST